jgi:hypothetical protein
MPKNATLYYSILVRDHPNHAWDKLGHHTNIADAIRALSMGIKLFAYVRLLDYTTAEILADFRNGELIYLSETYNGLED